MLCALSISKRCVCQSVRHAKRGSDAARTGGGDRHPVAHAALRWLLRRTARALILVASGKRAMAYDTAEQVLENKPT